MTLNELDQQSNECLQALYNSEYNLNRRRAEEAYNNVCSEIQEKKQVIDECVKNLDYDNAVCHEEQLAGLEARQRTLKKALDNFSAEPVYHHDDIVKICDAIEAERKKFFQNESNKLYKKLEGFLVSIDDIKAVIEEFNDMAIKYYKNSPRYDSFSNPYRGTMYQNYTYVREHIEEALQSLEPFLKSI